MELMQRRQFLAGIAAVPGICRAAAEAGSKISSIDIVHHTHTDVGYTELPSVVRDEQLRYLDAAIECCRADPSFRWTVESLVGWTTGGGRGRGTARLPLLSLVIGPDVST